MFPNLKARNALAVASLLLATPALAQAPQAGAPPAQAAQGAPPAQAQPTITKPPELVQQVEAPYPPDALARGVTASVRLIITIAEDGTVSDVQPTEPVGHGFDEAAQAAVRQFRFSPAEVDGVPAPVQVEYVYHFTLNAPPASDGAGQAQAAAAPKATLTGQLISRGSRSRVAGATVRCGDDPEAPEALSDADGRFTLEVPPGECEVRVVASGHQLYQTKEPLKENETTEVNFYLAPVGSGLETVVRSERPKKEVVRRTVTREEAQKTPGTFGDPIRVIQALPGVARAPFISGELLVRGSNPGQTATMMDGVGIPILFHLLGGPSVVNAEFIDQLDFYPGGYGSQYGRAVGGIVEVGTRKGAADTFHGSVKVDVLDAGFFLETPVTDGISVAAAARRSYIDTLLPLFLPKNEGSTLSVVPRYWDYQVRVDFGAKRGASLEAEAQALAGGARSTGYVMAFGSDDQLRVVSSGPKTDRDLSLDTRTLFHRVKGDWTYRKGALTSVFTPYVGYDGNSVKFGIAKQDGVGYTVGAREVLGLELSKELSVRTGLDLIYEYQAFEVEFPAPEGFEYVAFPGAQSVGELLVEKLGLGAFDGALFVEADVKVGPFTFTPGVRGNLQLVGDTRNLALDPRLWVRFAATERTSLKGSLGLYSQPPETFRFITLPYGNPDLIYQRAFQSSLGVEHRFADTFNVDVTGFFNRRFKNISTPGQIITREGGGVVQLPYSNEGIGRALGLEVMVKKDRASAMDKWSGWVSYTFSRSLDGRTNFQSDGGGGFGEATTPEYGLSPYDQTHILTLVTSYVLGNGWELGGRFRYTTGRPTTPLNHTYDLYQSDRNRFDGTYGPYASARAAGFHQLDVRLDKSYQFQNWTLGVYLDVQNLYNAKNVEFVFNDYRQRQEYEVPGIPILPVVGMKGSF